METSLPARLQLGIDNLRRDGLNLFSILVVGRLPQALVRRLAECDFPCSEQSRIVLIGNGGGTFWEALRTAERHQPDPIDHFSSAAAHRFADQVLSGEDYRLLYPGDSPLALQQLGTCAGWHAPSPLGLGINPQWGLWYAYRAVLLTNEPLPEVRMPAPLSPCETCSEKHCLSLCPARALSEAEAIDMKQCAGYRLSVESGCADRCLARLGCPVSRDQRYTLEQIQYHYRHSLETLRHYFG